MHKLTQQEFDDYFDKNPNNHHWIIKSDTIFEDIDFSECDCYLDKLYAISYTYFKNCINFPILSLYGGRSNKFADNWWRLYESRHLYFNNNIYQSPEFLEAQRLKDKSMAGKHVVIL